MAHELRTQLPADLAEDLARGAVYGYLVDRCLSLTVNAASDIEKHARISVDDALRLGVRSIPSPIANLVLAGECLARFGAEVLARIPGFYSFTRTHDSDCAEFSAECRCDIPAWRLDLDYWPRGLIIPVRNRVGWIVSLMVFRHAQDRYPFPLRVRTEQAA